MKEELKKEIIAIIDRKSFSEAMEEIIFSEKNLIENTNKLEEICKKEILNYEDDDFTLAVLGLFTALVLTGKIKIVLDTYQKNKDDWTTPVKTQESSNEITYKGGWGISGSFGLKNSIEIISTKVHLLYKDD